MTQDIVDTMIAEDCERYRSYHRHALEHAKAWMPSDMEGPMQKAFTELGRNMESSFVRLLAQESPQGDDALSYLRREQKRFYQSKAKYLRELAPDEWNSAYNKAATLAALGVMGGRKHLMEMEEEFHKRSLKDQRMLHTTAYFRILEDILHQDVAYLDGLLKQWEMVN